MRINGLAEKIADDIVAWDEAGRVVSGDPRLAAYQHALGVAVALREAMDDARAPLSIWAEWQEREDEAVGSMIVVGRLRAACRMAIDEAERTGVLSAGVLAALKLARE